MPFGLPFTPRLAEAAPARSPPQVFNTYGEYNSRKLLLDYGFVPADNPLDTAALDAPLLADACAEVLGEPAFAKRRGALCRAGGASLLEGHTDDGSSPGLHTSRPGPAGRGGRQVVPRASPPALSLSPRRATSTGFGFHRGGEPPAALLLLLSLLLATAPPRKGQASAAACRAFAALAGAERRERASMSAGGLGRQILELPKARRAKEAAKREGIAVLLGACPRGRAGNDAYHACALAGADCI